MDAKSLGKFIQACRKDLGLTQEELGIKLNVTDKAVSRWERGIGFPDVKLLEPLADALQISVEELIRCQRTQTETLAENMTEAKKKAWIYRHRSWLVAICLLVYMVLGWLQRNPQYTDQLFWLSPLNHLVFLLTVISFVYASYREVHHGTA